MNTITETRWLGQDIREIWFENSRIAGSFKPGQFLVIRHGETGERIPLTIVEVSDGRIRIIIQQVGYTTSRLCRLKKGESLGNVIGPLGHHSDIVKYGSCVCVAGGIGAAPLKPIAAELRKQGNRLTVIEGVRSSKYLILDKELEKIADRFILMSDDGSVGEKGLVTLPLKKMMEEGNRPDYVYAVGPPVMMKAVSVLTRQYGVPLTVSLNPIMVDATGMCGSCRVEVAGETKFACVDGPEFDGNKVNYDLLMNRLKVYADDEKHAGCDIGGDNAG
ncbi:MAG: sulfide/dihydroorotate dehydrogenase-like FAD/NAD-binding protein [Elusimicrobia bacterium]|nr:sulfide/dihydroorotate dehydrogenase-like FAD/NAD-binding protein [Elusimicrobiota bacterium]